MIESVSVRNFQSLESVDLELGTVTVIVGPNDTGKSALFRAIRAASEAQAGVDFITLGKTQTRVTIRADGRRLSWIKGQAVNRYELDDQVFEKVGRQVPPEVEQFLGTGPVAFGDDVKLNLNFADQDDPPFLIPYPGGMSTSSVAKVLGDLTNLNLLFRALHEADTRRKRDATVAKFSQEEIERLTLQLNQFDDLSDRQEQAAEAEQLYQASVRKQSHLWRLQAAVTQREDLRSRHANQQARISALGPNLTAEAGSLAGKWDRWHRLHDAQLQLSHQERILASREENATRAIDRSRDAKNQLNELLDSIDVCPICDRPMDREHAHA